MANKKNPFDQFDEPPQLAHSFEPENPFHQFTPDPIEIPKESPIFGPSALLTPREALVAAGTTAATVVAPQFTIPAALGKFAKPAQFLANTASRMFGAGTGGVAGDVAGNIGFEDTTDPEELFESAQQTFKNEALLEGAFGVAGVGIKKIGQAINKPATDAAKKILEFSRSINAPVSAQSLRPNFVTNTIGEMAELPLFGNLTADFFRDKQLGAINDFSVQVVRQHAAPPGNTAIETLSEPFFSSFRKKVIENKNESFEAVLDPVRNITTNDVGSFADAIDEIREGTSNQVVKDFIDRDIKTDLKDGTLTYQRLYNRLVDLGNKRIVGSGGRRDAEALRKAFKEQERRMIGNEAANAIENARASFLALDKIIKNKSLQKLAGKDIPFKRNHLAANELIKSGNEDIIREFKAALPELDEDIQELGLNVTGNEMWNQYLAQNLENLFTRASKEGQFPGERLLDGEKILQQIERNRDAYIEAYGDETLTAIENLAEFANFSVKAAKKQAGQTLLSGQMGQTLRGGANIAGMFTNPVGVVVSNGLAPGLVWGIMAPNSPLKKWLVEGSPAFRAISTAGKETAKFGARAAAAPDSPAEQERDNGR